MIREAAMPTKTEPTRQLTLLHMVLFVACCAALCQNLKIIAIDQRQNVEIIWREIWARNPVLSAGLSADQVIDE